VNSEARFCRQEILPEIGPSGQALLQKASLRLPQSAPELSRQVALCYAERAGIVRVTEDGTPEPGAWGSAPWLAAFRHSPAAEVALGATLALDAMQQALSLHSEESRTESAVS
jgi:hypothetical protein